METDRLAVERVSGRSTVTRFFSKYPLKFIVPTKAGPSEIDVVWIYTLTYGGAIVFGLKLDTDPQQATTTPSPETMAEKKEYHNRGLSAPAAKRHLSKVPYTCL